MAVHPGRVVKTTGDDMLVEFASVVDALRCATEIQMAMAERTRRDLDCRPTTPQDPSSDRFPVVQVITAGRSRRSVGSFLAKKRGMRWNRPS